MKNRITSILDKAIPIKILESYLESTGHLIQIAKLGWGLSLVDKFLKERIELYNSSSNDISILDWGLTDDSSDLFKWRFPNTIINSGDYLVIMASDKNRTEMISQWETIIDWGDQWHYFVGNQAPPIQWNQVGFNTSSWDTGASGFGYGDNDDNTVINQTISIFIVKTFFFIRC